MKQTAVEWLIEKTFSDFGKSVKSQEIKTALQMEKLQTEISDEEIEKAAELSFGGNERNKSVWVNACKWYREQLKKKQ